MHRYITLTTLLSSAVIALGVFSPAHAAKPTGGGGSSTQVLTVRTACDGANGCYENLQTAASAAFSTATASAPVAVDIGPGTFTLAENAAFCSNAGHVSFKGNGRENTIITGSNITHAPTGGVSVIFVMKIENCTKISFQDLTISRHDAGDQSGGILWTGGGDSSWSNILVDVDHVGWWDLPGDFSEHFWFGSAIQAIGTENWYYRTAIYSESGLTWFYGGDLASVSNQTNNPGIYNIATVRAIGNGDIRVFGTSIRAAQNNALASNTEASGTLAIYGLRADGANAEIHAHGAVVNVFSATASEANIGCANIRATGGAKVHTPGTAYVSRCENGNTISRIYADNISDVDAPFNWGSGDNPPLNITSKSGQDMFVEVDCEATDCHPVAAGTSTHLMVYNPNCNVIGHGPWFDINMNNCRGSGTAAYTQ